MLTNEEKCPANPILEDKLVDNTMKETQNECNQDRQELDSGKPLGSTEEVEHELQASTSLNYLSNQSSQCPSAIPTASSGCSFESEPFSAPIMLANSNMLTSENQSEITSPFFDSTNDKIWSLGEATLVEDFNGQAYIDGLGQRISSYPDQSMLKQIQIGPNHNLLKRSMPGHFVPAARNSPNSSLYSSSSVNNLTNKSPNYGSHLNWSGMSHVQPSNLAWSGAFNSTLPAVPSTLNSFSSGPNNSTSLPNAWSNPYYASITSQKRSPMGSQPGISAVLPKKNPLYPGEGITRRSFPKNFVTSSLSGQTNIYDLGSTGSDNTSSSSDSANLRENGLILQEKSIDPHLSPLDSLRYSLEPQLLEIMRNNANHETTKAMNYTFQPVVQGEDKKLLNLKGRTFNRRRGKSPFFTGSDSDPLIADFAPSSNESNERFSRKVFVGGLPPDIDEEEITASFRRFGPLVVDWPHKAESKSYFPPKGYAFLLFQDEASVQLLIDACIQEDDKLYLCVSSPTIKDKPVQIRPWRLSDADYVLDASMPLDPRKTVFVGGVPRPLKAVELAMIMDRLYGGVCYAGIDTDPELKYPKGAGRVAFSNQQSYIAAISARFVQLQHVDIEKRVEVKPYVLDDQICDECQGARCAGKFAPYFCANITCLQYYCENCWATIHSRPGREFHKPLVKEGADRPRAVPFRWC